jgi:hypothetical protein
MNPIADDLLQELGSGVRRIFTVERCQEEEEEERRKMNNCSDRQTRSATSPLRRQPTDCRGGAEAAGSEANSKKRTQ